MTADYPTDEVAATPEYVFHLLWKLRTNPFPNVPPAPPYESLADEPADKLFGPFAADLWWALDEVLDVPFPDDEDTRALQWLDGYTVRQVCEFVAARITRPVVRPWRHVGGECLPAGAFLTARALLVRLGADPDRITPSAPLARYVRWYGRSFLSGLARLAPDRVPSCTERFPLAGFLMIVLAPVPILVAMLLDKCGVPVPAGVVVAAVFSGFPFTVAGIALALREEWRPRLGDLVTFRDLAYALAGQEPRRRIQPLP